MTPYYSLYCHSIRKLLKSKNKTFAVLGHLHTPHQEKDFTVIGTFHEGNIYEDDQVVAITDVHLGIFNYPPEKLKKLKSILQRTDKKVILMGDFFDLFYMTPQEIQELYSDLIEFIKQREHDGGLVYLQGNHDSNITPPISPFPRPKSINLETKFSSIATAAIRFTPSSLSTSFNIFVPNLAIASTG